MAIIINSLQKKNENRKKGFRTLPLQIWNCSVFNDRRENVHLTEQIPILGVATV